MFSISAQAAHGYVTVRVLEELAGESIRDELPWSPSASLGYHLGYHISVAQALEDNSSDAYLATSYPYFQSSTNSFLVSSRYDNQKS